MAAFVFASPLPRCPRSPRVGATQRAAPRGPVRTAPSCTGGFVDDSQFTLAKGRRHVSPDDFPELEALPVETHTNLFPREQVVDELEAGFRRHAVALRRFGAGDGRDCVGLFRHRTDPSWGVNRNRAPVAPRYVLIERSPPPATASGAEGTDGGGARSGSDESAEGGGGRPATPAASPRLPPPVVSTQRWIGALERFGDTFFRSMPAHEVHYRVLREVGEVDLGAQLAVSAAGVDAQRLTLAVELLNADWRSLRRVRSMSDALVRWGEEIVAAGALLRCTVLQSADAPSVFKVVEYYRDEDALIRHISARDREHDEAVRPYRAAVNRVRQVYALVPP